MEAPTARDLILATLARHPDGVVVAHVLRENAAEEQPRRALFLKGLGMLERRGLVVVSGPAGCCTLIRGKGRQDFWGALVRLRQDQPAAP